MTYQVSSMVHDRRSFCQSFATLKNMTRDGKAGLATIRSGRLSCTYGSSVEFQLRLTFHQRKMCAMNFQGPVCWAPLGPLELVVHPGMISNLNSIPFRGCRYRSRKVWV